MADPRLVGNGETCPSCNGLRRTDEVTDEIEYADGRTWRFYAPCPTCAGTGRIAYPEERVYAETVKEKTR